VQRDTRVVQGPDADVVGRVVEDAVAVLRGTGTVVAGEDRRLAAGVNR
jgi:hypothetical protein